MQYKEQHFQYELDSTDGDFGQDAGAKSRKQYRRGRPFRNARRRTKKSTSQPGPGIGGRRNHRWSW